MDPSANTTEPLDPTIPESLSSPEAFPGLEDPGPVTVVQTHLSHVFLTRERVYKLHKDVDLGFVSFDTQRERNRDCLRELELNRRLAPDVYLGIAKLERRGSGWIAGPVVPHPPRLEGGEHCLVMRRLPSGRDALSLLEADRLARSPLERLARTLARFHEQHSLGRPCRYSERDWMERIEGPVEANFESLLERTPDVVPRSDVIALRGRARASWQRVRPAVERRRLEGRGVDGHGDLHLDHVWFETGDAEPLVIDCIAFDEKLRHIDSASDVAFLAMDLGSRGHVELAEHWLAAYAAAADDYGLYDVVDFFMSYRAAVRAKVAAIETIEDSIPEKQRREARSRARRRAEYAARVLESREPGRVHLVGGIIGGGKSTAARRLSAATGAVVVSSDEVRRSIATLEVDGATGGWREGRYAKSATERVYTALFERAASVVASGRDVILDASWASKARRERAREWAAQLGSRRPRFVEIRCAREVALERLAERRWRGGDASEAGPEIYEEFVRTYETPDEWPAEDRVTVDSDRDGWAERLLEALRG